MIVDGSHNVPTMFVTLEQARALSALAQEGTLQKAAAKLHKGHTAVLYALTGLEEQTGLLLLDRSGYRLRLTPEGQAVLIHARKMLDAERELVTTCQRIQSGWEPSVRLVFDGIVPIGPVLGWMRGLMDQGAPTKVSVSAEFLAGVEEAFERAEADFMMAVLPPLRTGLASHRMPPVRARLCAHRSHPLAQAKKLSAADLSEHVLLTVRGSDPRLSLPTAGLEVRSQLHLNDFETKKQAILRGLGFGWLPEHVAGRELARGTLVTLRYAGGAEHTFAPRLFHRAAYRPGKAGTALLKAVGAS